MNPLSPNLSELSDEELHERLTKILDRMNFAQRSGNGSLYQQLHNNYQDILLEKEDRVIRKQKELEEKGEEDPFDQLINIKK
jgi:hypothetical protein